MELTLEAYRNVVNYVGNRSDISILCRVSRTFRRVAERALYNTIYLRNTHEALTLCATLADQPRLASLIDALTISSIEESDGSESDEDDEEEEEDVEELPDSYWPSIARALEHTNNLRYLNIHSPKASLSSCAWIFKNCTFHLRRLHCDFNWDHDFVNFLNTQNDMEDLYILDYRQLNDTTTDTNQRQSSSVSTILHASAMPKLMTLECTFSEAADDIVPRRPITHLKTCFSRTEITTKREEMSRLLTNITLSSRALHSLDIADSSYSEAFSMELLRTIVSMKATTVELRYLGTLVLPIQGQERLRFYGSLMRLPRLQCVELDVTEWVPPPSTAPAFRALASELRLYSPSITCVVFVRDFDRTVVTAVNGVCSVNAEISTDLLWREV